MSTYFVIIRLSPFLSMYITQIFYSEEMKRFQIFGCIFSFLGALIITIPSFTSYGANEADSPIGILCALAVMIFLSASNILNNHWQRSNLDLVILFMGIYSGAIGCFFMISTTNGMDHLNIFHWLLIILDAIATYYSLFFHVKSLKIANNVNKLVPFSFFQIILTMFLGIVFFKQIVQIHDIIGILVILLSTYFYSKNLLISNRKLSNSTDDFYNESNE